MVWAVLPFVVPRYIADLLVFTGIYTVAGLGIGLLLGHCGIVNLAQATFYGLGAYASAYCTVMMGLPSIVGFLVGAAISMALAYVIGRPILRLTGYFLALGTLALSAIASALFFEWDWLTGGTLGIGGIPKLDLFGFLLDRPSRYYFFVWIVAFACMAVARNLVDSRTGLMLRCHARLQHRGGRPLDRSAGAANQGLRRVRPVRQPGRQPVRPPCLVRQHAELHRRPLDQLPADPGDRRRDLDPRHRGRRAVRHLPARAAEQAGRHPPDPVRPRAGRRRRPDARGAGRRLRQAADRLARKGSGNG